MFDFVQVIYFSFLNKFNEVAWDINGFLYDIQVEAQNILLGTLFKRKLEVRKTLDQRYLVLTSQDSRQLAQVKAYVQETEKIKD